MGQGQSILTAANQDSVQEDTTHSATQTWNARYPGWFHHCDVCRNNIEVAAEDIQLREEALDSLLLSVSITIGIVANKNLLDG